MRPALCIYSFGAIFAGVLDIVFANFDRAHQPMAAISDKTPAIVAYIFGSWMVLGGALLLYRHTARIGSLLTGLVYLFFALCWIPRFHSAAKAFGVHFATFEGVFAGLATQALSVGAAAILWAYFTDSGLKTDRLSAAVYRWVFGLSSLSFGVYHLLAVRDVATLVPKWMWPGGNFWVVFTGIAFICAGLAIITGILEVLAARMLSLMLAVFSLLSLVPLLIAYPHSHEAWGGNAYNLAAIGAVWIFAEYLAEYRRRVAR